MISYLARSLLMLTVGTGLLLATTPLGAQLSMAPPSGGAPIYVQPGVAGPQIIQVETGNPLEAKPEQAEEKPDEKPGDEPKEDQEGTPKKPSAKKEEEKPKTIKRPIEPPEKPDPKEFEIRPDASGKVRFSFRGQAWPDVLDWLADVSDMSLDWQELPADYLNLVTQRAYALDEARDLINRHLLARGFTMLVADEVLSVFKIDSINPGLVPRVEPEELDGRSPHEFVKVSFPLDWLVAEAVAEELKPMISPNGKLTALKGTNRLEAMDAVANLQEIRKVLDREQSVGSQERLVREFVLQYARASNVREQLLNLIGMESKKQASPMPVSPEQMEMMQQQAAMMAQVQAQQGVPPGVSPGRKTVDVNLVVNTRRNSILVNAPPDRMAIIEKAVEVIDVPPDREQSLLLNINRMQVYRLAALDPKILVETLEETGDLDPTTRLDVDSKNRAIIAYASLADHLTIRTVIDKLDGSGRQFEVIRLRELPADYVAGTIAFMMGQEEKKEDNRSRYLGFFGFGPSRSSDDQEQDQFRVDADVEGNRLLLWANDIELNEVTNLLVKLGETPTDGAGADRVRVMNVHLGDTPGQLLDQIRRAWPSLAPNQLILPAEESPPRPLPDDRQEPLPGPKDGPEARSQPQPRGGSVIRFAQLHQPSTARTEIASDDTLEAPKKPLAEPAVPKNKLPVLRERLTYEPRRPSPPPPDTGVTRPISPVQIAIGPDGRLVISSQDTAALDLLEELLSQLAPPRKDYELFSLKYASSFWTRLNLQDFFKEEKDDKTSRRQGYFFSDYPPPEQKEQRFRLSKRRPLRFIDDPDTNSILVVGADPEQLATIRELIQLWDVPPPSDSESARISAVFQVRYSRAEIIAEAIKDVYLDLLSSNDKALQQGRGEKRPENQTTYIFGDGGNEEPDRRTQVAFKGKLSIGVDAVSNTILVSTEGQNLMDNVSKMIQSLDEAALPLSHVQVMTLEGGVNAARVRGVLAEMLNDSSSRSAGSSSGQTHTPSAGQPGLPVGNGGTTSPAPGR